LTGSQGSQLLLGSGIYFGAILTSKCSGLIIDNNEIVRVEQLKMGLNSPGRWGLYGYDIKAVRVEERI